MAYNNAIPAAGNLLSQSQADILNNFIAIATVVDPNNGTLTLTQAAAPATGANQVSLYALTGTSALRIKTATTDVDIMSAGKTTTGWCILPSGIIMKWGYGSITAANAYVTATTTLASGAGVPTINTLLAPLVTKSTQSELIVSYDSFNEALHTVSVTAIKAFAGAQATTFNYLLIGI